MDVAHLVNGWSKPLADNIALSGQQYRWKKSIYYQNIDILVNMVNIID